MLSKIYYLFSGFRPTNKKSLYLYETKMTLCILLAFPGLCISAEKAMKEKDYQNLHCKGEIEYRLSDRTRVDCLTDTHAIEYDFGSKWAEAIGQSLYYAFQTNKKAGIVLIYKKPSDVRYYHRLMSVINHNKLSIDVWVIDVDQEKAAM